MSIIFQKPGILTTVQDTGRNGFRRFGINPNGAMDKTAARLINILLGNNEGEAVLETHFPAPEVMFEKDSIFALGGAVFDAKLNDENLENWKPHYAEKGSVLKFTKRISGNRAYLSIKGGFRIEKWLGSASTNLTANIGGFSGRKLQKGDRLLFKVQGSKFKVQSSRDKFQNIRISNSLIPFYTRLPTVRVIAGAEFESLNALSEQCFLQESFSISQNSDRMGFCLSGEHLFLHENKGKNKELVSSAVNFGTIQLLPDGQLIILMADHQTSGGYPRIAHIIEADLPIAAQLSAGDEINFQLISLKKAEEILLEQEINLNFLRAACKFRQV